MFKFLRQVARQDATSRAAANLRVYCVTHEPPLVPDALADFIVGIGDYHPPITRGAHISTLDSFWDQMRPYAYGAAGNYVIPKAMDSTGLTKFTGIFSHRKIIVRTQIGRKSPNSDYTSISIALMPRSFLALR